MSGEDGTEEAAATASVTFDEILATRPFRQARPEIVDLVAAANAEVLSVVHASAARRQVAKQLLAALDAELAVTRDQSPPPRARPPCHPARAGPASFAAAVLATTTARRLPSPRRLLLPADVAHASALVTLAGVEQNVGARRSAIPVATGE
jgi:hypothetical protein